MVELYNLKFEPSRFRKLRRAVSNLKLYNGNLIVSYSSAFKIHDESFGEDMGWMAEED